MSSARAPSLHSRRSASASWRRRAADIIAAAHVFALCSVFLDEGSRRCGAESMNRTAGDGREPARAMLRPVATMITSAAACGRSNSARCTSGRCGSPVPNAATSASSTPCRYGGCFIGVAGRTRCRLSAEGCTARPVGHGTGSRRDRGSLWVAIRRRANRCLIPTLRPGRGLCRAIARDRTRECAIFTV